MAGSKSMLEMSIFRKEVRTQQAYPIEDIACPVKLDANENPYLLPQTAKRRLWKRLREIPLNRYPEPGSPEVLQRFALHFGIDRDMIMVGNGSDELIGILCTAVGGEGTPVMVPVPTFAMYRISAQNNGHKVLSIPLDETFDLDVARMLDAIEKESPSLIFISYPNNPTGNCFRRSHIEDIIRSSRGIVVVDEAYYPFSGKTFIEDMKKFDNLVILRTLSKVGLAAMRLGFLLGNPEVIHQLNKVRLPYNLNAVSQMAALFYLEEEKLFTRQVERINREKDHLFRGLRKIDGIVPYPSDANFVFFGCTNNSNSVYTKLIKRGVVVKPFVPTGGVSGNFRVTVGTRDENGKFLEELKSIVAEVRGVI